METRCNFFMKKLLHKTKEHQHITSFQVIFLGFFLVILTGSLILMLPWATRSGTSTPFLEALFTATSAVCVTGLVVHDTVTYWSTFGQAIIMILIQIGGMGIVTVAVALAIISGKKIGLRERSTMQESIAAPQVGGIVRMTGFILRTTFLIELIGACCLSVVFIPQFGLLKGIWYSVFHAVSAFCNAGFDLMGSDIPYSSLTAYAANPIVNFTIMALIVVGGIGFATWDDIKERGRHIRKYRMQSKVILTVTAFLILSATIYFFFCEFTELPLGQRILASMFQAVTPRTAGFNTVDLTMISEVGVLVTILLMLIGGSPGSTAGGMKTTTVAVLFSTAISVFKKKESANLYSRRLPDSAVKNAATVLMMYVVLFLGGGMIISAVEDVPLLSALFETSSAIGTVGLTLGLTTTLGTLSQVILIFLMFFGRVGGLTIIFAALAERHASVSKYPEGKITIG